MKHSLAYTQTGTPYYASPEVWQDKPYELKSDIWSLGCILYETAALKPPFTATSMDGLYKKVNFDNKQGNERSLSQIAWSVFIKFVKIHIQVFTDISNKTSW